MAQEIIPKYIKAVAIELICSKIMTPFLIFDESEIIQRTHALKSMASDLFPSFGIYFSYKTINNHNISQIFRKAGFGAEVASLDEFDCSLIDSTSENGIVFDGTLKKHHELEQVIAHSVNSIIHLDNIDEAKQAINIVCKLKNKTMARFGIRLCHLHSVKGKENNKEKENNKAKESRFGFNKNELKALFNIPNIEILNISGIHIHAGSNLSSIDCFKETFKFYKTEIAHILGKKDPWLDIGGGFPANSKKETNHYSFAAMLKDYHHFLLHNIDLSRVKIIIEPGRFLCEDSGYLVSKIHHLKQRNGSLLLTCDIGLNYVSSIRSWNHRIECLFGSEKSTLASLYGSNCFELDLISNEFSYDIIDPQYIVVRGCGGYDIPSTNFWLRKPYDIFSTTETLEIIHHNINTNCFHGRLMKDDD